jgi:hypothetical protein
MQELLAMIFPSHCQWSLLKKSSVAAGMLLNFGPPKHSLEQVVNHTKSLAVESLRQDKAGYKLGLHNTSTVAVFGVAISLNGSKGVCDLHAPLSSSGGPFIGPKEGREIPLRYTKSKPNWLGHGGESCSANPPGGPGIVIDAADFADGTCDGDEDKCAMMEAVRLGLETQHQRLAALVEEEVKSGEHANWVEALGLRASALPDEPEPATVDSIRTRFQQPASANKSLGLDMQWGLMWEREFFLNNLKVYSLVSSKYGKPRVSLQEWWNVTKGRCDFFSPQICC